MRGSLKKLAGAVSGDSSSSSAGGGGGDAGAEWLRALAGSAWLSHCAELLAASCLVADRLHCGAPVLVHCSDGWDRTSQIVATVQLLCDPHFRTLRGFGDLVEKDWCAFGHMFEVRGGGLHVATSGGSGGGAKASSLSHDDPKAEHETSPIFLQWLEVVWQLTAQFPAAFEFGEALLLFLADHVHARWCGTLLYSRLTSAFSFFYLLTHSLFLYLLQQVRDLPPRHRARAARRARDGARGRRVGASAAAARALPQPEVRRARRARWWWGWGWWQQQLQQQQQQQQQQQRRGGGGAGADGGQGSGCRRRR